jgi:hypothetical protein
MMMLVFSTTLTPLRSGLRENETVEESYFMVGQTDAHRYAIWGQNLLEGIEIFRHP